MGKNNIDNMSAAERAALLMSLMRPPDQMPTPDAVEANRILESLRINQPKNINGTISIRNPVTNIQGNMFPTPQGREVSFTSNGRYSRPSVPNTKLQTLGSNATVNQLINELPTTRNKATGVDNRYTFTPLDDAKDLKRALKTGKRTNSRNTAYKRNTNGAFNAHVRKDGEIIGHGTRKGETTWQPRNAGGKFGKHVQFDPTDVVKKIGKFAIEKGSVHFIPKVGPALQTMMTVDSTVEGITGKSPIKEFMSIAEKSIKDQSIPRPATLMMY
jgi:hypothetical protein